MRYLLLFLLVGFQSFAFGYSSNNQLKNDVQKTLTTQKSDLELQKSKPFMYQGQYFDKEIELAYNRFRYYDPNDGRYISVDPIGLLSGENNFYSYVDDSNGYIDALGLAKSYGNRAKWGENDYSRGGKKKAIDHIWEGHSFHRAPDGKSKFRQNINSKDKVKSMVNESVRPENLISTNADGTRNYVHTFDHSIGTDINGNSTKQMIVHTDANGWVQSAYPL